MTMKMTRRSQPPGPTDLELLNILRRRIEREQPSSFITDMHNLYEIEPWLLQHVRHVRFVENMWFYFVTRKQRPAIKKKSDSRTPSRKVVGSGRWKTTGVLNHIEDKDGVRVGSMTTISFKVNSETVKDEITTGWVMDEFVLDKPGFQELVLCRIRFCKRKNNAQYAPRFAPIVIGLEREDGSKLVENNSQNHIQAQQGMASSSGEVVSNLAIDQHQQVMGQDDSNYPIVNGGMEQHQSLGSCGQLLGESSGQHRFRGRQGTYLSHMEIQQQQSRNYFWGQGTDPSHSAQAMKEERQLQWYGYLEQGTTDPQHVPMMKNQALNEKQQWNEYLGQEKVPLTQCLVTHCKIQHWPSQHQHFSVMEQAMEEKLQGNGYSGPYVQRVMDHQIFGSSDLSLAQNNMYLRKNNDLLALRGVAAQQTHLSQGTNLPLTQQQNKFLGEATQNVPCSAQPHDQYKGETDELPVVPMETQQHQNNELPTFPMETQQEQNNQVHLEAQEDDFFPEMDSEMDNLPNDFCLADLAQQFEKIPIPYSLLF